ncbi:pre-mRNA-processing protein 40C-like isoform X2 [Pistacia vera]|uniref:pre-mRNA-processing protein 40C-like isoform X2 n=1 Tax=Pistacia vera TaxID=55513 RepID=UPI0012630CB9|nr:pre-mRNA-processing protein 40C-like isoform X2 [Pistacia vera]
MLMVTVNMSDSSSDSKDEDSGPSKEDCITKFKEMLKERGVAPFSKWEKELPKNVFDPRFKAIPSQSVGRALFEPMLRHVLRRKDIDYNTDYQTFRKKWGSDPRFEALDARALISKLTEEKNNAIQQNNKLRQELVRDWHLISSL